MNKIKISLLISFLLVFNHAFCDVIPDNAHFVEKCILITNAADFPNMALIGHITEIGTSITESYVILPTKCLSKGYKFNTFRIFALPISLTDDPEFRNIDWSNNLNSIKCNISVEPYKGYVYNSNPLSGIEEFYRIVGFTDTSVVLYKWKEILIYNNGAPDELKTYSYEGDSAALSMNIPTRIKENTNNSFIELCPNPAQKNFNITIKNDYQGNVAIKLFSFEGKPVRVFSLNKTDSIIDYRVDVTQLPKETYFVAIIMGTAVEVKKIVIK